jgi:signal transduction histidine kinase
VHELVTCDSQTLQHHCDLNIWLSLYMSMQESEYALFRTVLRKASLAFVVATVVLSLLLLLIYQQDIRSQRTILEHEAEHVLDLQQELLTAELRRVQSDLLYLSSQDLLQKFLLNKPQAGELLEKEYVNFAIHKATYGQVRVLDPSGLEIIRVNYRNGEAAVVPSDELQSKANRYYYQQAIPLSKGEVFVSPFDLNVEHGDLERPIQPVIRFVTPIIDESGTRQGVLVLNYLGTRLLTRLKQISNRFRGDTMLVNSVGEFLQAPDPDHQWGWLLGHQRSFRNDFPNAWAGWKDRLANRVDLDQDLFMFRLISPGLRSATRTLRNDAETATQEPGALVLISRVSASAVSLQSRELLNQLRLIGAAVLPVVALLAFYWARSGATRQLHESHVAESELRLRQLSSALLEAQETERRSISRVLHDELGQLVTAIRLDLGSLKQKWSNSDLLERAIDETDQLLDSLHRIASRVRPSVLDDLGLKDAIISFISEYEQRSEISVTSRLLFDQDKIPVTTGENAYRIVTEAMSNVAAHARTDEVEVLLESDDKMLRIMVKDAGAGFDTRELQGSDRLGILGMRERADLLNGKFSIVSSPNSGTQIDVSLPLEFEAVKRQQVERA